MDHVAHRAHPCHPPHPGRQHLRLATLRAGVVKVPHVEVDPYVLVVLAVGLQGEQRRDEALPLPNIEGALVLSDGWIKAGYQAIVSSWPSPV
jgi:hypothetical protein